MKPIVQRIALPKNRRIIAVSDVHGHCGYLQNLLEKVGFCSDDILFIVGDLLEKGPQNLKTLRYVMELCENYTVYPMLGNVDYSSVYPLFDDDSESSSKLFWRMKWFVDWKGSSILSDMLHELDIRANSPDDITSARGKIAAHFAAELDFMRSLPTVIETQNLIFVHGGIKPDAPQNYDKYDMFSYLKWDNFHLDCGSFDKYIIVGHTPVTLYGKDFEQHNPIIDSVRKIISIDGGCGLKKGGQLNALIIPELGSDEFTYACFDELPVMTALDKQEKCVDSSFVRVFDDIEVVESGEQITKILHKPSGRIMSVPSRHIFDSQNYGGKRCDDFSDYRFGVLPGEKLSFIEDTPFGARVKKNGIVSLYSGRLK